MQQQLPAWLDLADKLGSVVSAVIAVGTPIAAAIAVFWRWRGRVGRRSERTRRLSVIAWLWAAAAAGAAACRMAIGPAGRTGRLLAAVSIGAAGGIVGTVILLVREKRRLRPPLSEIVLRWLEVQGTEMEQHHYRFGGAVPPVSKLYVQRTATRDTPADADPLTVHQMLAESTHAVVLADPGGGKSMLASWLAGESAKFWLAAADPDPRSEATSSGQVVTYVPARSLVGTDVVGGLVAYWSAAGVGVGRETVSMAPAKNVSWLVVVDGLDEIADADDRSAVIGRLAEEMRRGQQGDRHRRVLVTSRPLPAAELSNLQRAGAGSYRLRPFGAEQLKAFALNWFTERPRAGLDPEVHVKRFLDRVDEAKIAGMLEVPLLATMAIMLYELTPELGLPNNRTGIYQDFVKLLQSRNTDGAATPLVQWLTDTPSSPPKLLWALADAQLGNEHEDLLGAATAWVRENDDGTVTAAPTPAWIGSLRSALLGCSLLTHRHDRIEFLHPSLAEYVATDPRRAGFDEDRWLLEVADPATRSLGLFRLGRSNTAPEAVVARLADWDPVAAGHVLADGVAVSADFRRRIVERLIGVAAHDSAAARECVTLVVRAAADPATWTQVAEQLVRAGSVPGWVRAVAANELAELDAERGIPLLRHVAEADDVDEPSASEWAASRLSARGDELGERIYAILRAAGRPLTADVLSGLDDFKLQAYRATARDPREPAEMRLRAAMTLAISAGLDDPESIEVLRTLAHDVNLSHAERLWAAGALALTGDQGAAIALRSAPASPEASAGLVSLLVSLASGLLSSLVRQAKSTLTHRVNWLLELASPRQRSLRRYRINVAKRYREVFVPFAGGRIVDLTDVYVPLRLETRSTGYLRAPGRPDSSQRMVVVGDPGSGKTMLLRSMMLDWAQLPAGSFRALPVPVLVGLHRCEGIRPIEDEIVEQMQRDGFATRPRAVTQMLRRGKLTVLFDGLDEVPPDRRRAVEHWLLRLTHQYPLCRMVVTCRPISYHGELSEGFETIAAVSPPSDDQIEQYLRKLSAAGFGSFDVPRLIATLRASPSLRQLAGNPYMLTLIAFVATARAWSRVQDRTSYFQEAVFALLESRSGTYSRREKESVLRRLALAAYDKRASLDGLPREWVLSQITAMLDRLGLGPEHAIPMLDEIVQQSGFLIPISSDDDYSFAALALQEFLAAKELLNDPAGLLTRFTEDPVWWREPVKLWCGLTDRDPADLIKAVCGQDSILALECLAEAQRYEDDLVAVVLRCVLDDPANADRLRLGGVRTALASLGPRCSADLLYQCASPVARQPGDLRRPVSYVMLAVAGTKESVSLLGTCAQDDPRALDELAAMGDAAAAPLAGLANNGRIDAVDALARVNTPSAMAELVTLLQAEGPAAQRAAIHTVIALASPETPASVRQAVVGSAADLVQAWRREGTPAAPNGELAWIIERVGALLRPTR